MSADTVGRGMWGRTDRLRAVWLEALIGQALIQYVISPSRLQDAFGSVVNVRVATMALFDHLLLTPSNVAQI